MILHSLSIGAHFQTRTLFICPVCQRQGGKRWIISSQMSFMHFRSMDFILKPLLHNEELFNFHRQVLKESMLEAITSNDKDVLGSSTILQTLAVESVAKQEIARVLFGTTGESTSRAPFTRRKEHKFKKIMSNWRELRMKRLSDEHYLSNTFISDVKRSKIELKFIIMKQQKV